MIQKISYESQDNHDETAKIVIKGLFKYFCKILRCLWSTSINDLSAETSKTAIIYLKDLSKLT